jgi:hypothetical protein
MILSCEGADDHLVLADWLAERKSLSAIANLLRDTHYCPANGENTEEAVPYHGIECLPLENDAFLWLTFTPLIAEMQFFRSPEQFLQDSNWISPRPIQAGLFYLILGLPVWIGMLNLLKKHLVGVALAVFIWGLSITFPSVPVWFPMLGTFWLLLALIKKSALRVPILKEQHGGLWRVGFILFVAFGILTQISLYQPRFLRKLGMGFLPRNNPHYAQMGWQKGVEPLKSQLMIAGSNAGSIVLTDSDASRDQVQYLLKDMASVFSVTRVDIEEWSLQKNPIFYIQEIYFAQINPRVIFLPRTEWLTPAYRTTQKELACVQVFQKGDPIRQFQLYSIDPTIARE